MRATIRATRRELRLEKRKNHANGVTFGLDSFETGSALQIVESAVIKGDGSAFTAAKI
jgi:ribosomal protein L21E